MKKDLDVIKKIVDKTVNLEVADADSVQRILQKHPLSNGRVPKKSIVLEGFNNLLSSGGISMSIESVKKVRTSLQMKKTRTISGVTPVTVLTKPFPCPGKCIFCPSDIRMPKSYLSSEPGAQRASKNRFDPYFQTYNRLCAYAGIGHPTDKIELIILGGTWSVYPKEYQIWFVKRCFDAMNDFDSDNFFPKDPTSEMPFEDIDLPEGVKSTEYNKQVTLKRKEASNETNTWEELFASQKINETAFTRCVGLVVETRPEYITEEEVTNIRKLGATKVQIGIQSLNNEVLELNKRGHDVEKTKKAFKLLWDTAYDDLVNKRYGAKIYLDHVQLNLRQIQYRIPRISSLESYAYCRNPPEIIVRDYLAGMTDQYFLHQFPDHLRPKPLDF